MARAQGGFRRTCSPVHVATRLAQTSARWQDHSARTARRPKGIYESVQYVRFPGENDKTSWGERYQHGSRTLSRFRTDEENILRKDNTRAGVITSLTLQESTNFLERTI